MIKCVDFIVKEGTSDFFLKGVSKVKEMFVVLNYARYRVFEINREEIINMKNNSTLRSIPIYFSQEGAIEGVKIKLYPSTGFEALISFIVDIDGKMMYMTNCDIELILEENMKDKSKWFCSKDIVPDEGKLIIVKYTCLGIIFYGIGKFEKIYSNDGVLNFYTYSHNDMCAEKNLRIGEFFTDINENGDIVHFVYWRYLDE